MIIKPPQTKISKAQYKAILERELNRAPVGQQQSQALTMQNQMQGLPSLTQGLGTGQPMQAPAQSPMAGMVSAPDPQVQLVASQTWEQLKDTAGGALWARLSRSPSPDQAFVEAATMFMQDPNSITDERVKQFLAGVLPQQQSPMGGESDDPLTDLILSNMR